MRLRKIPGADAFVAADARVLDEKTAPIWRGRWHKLFDDTPRPLRLEIGCGRGRFILASATAEPNINFLALELRDEMIMQALEKIESPLPNLRFLHLNAALLPELFAPGEIDRIYLNFPDPWPKARHAKRRLTTTAFLSVYRELLPPSGQIHFKTDNRDLFDWSLPNFSAAGYTIKSLSYDLPDDGMQIMTEYELRYRRKGQAVYYVCAEK